MASRGRQFLDLTGVVGRGGGVRSDAVVTAPGATYQRAFDLGAFFVAGQGSYGDVTVLGFLGMTDVEWVYAEGLALGADAERAALADAERQIEAAPA